QVLPCPLAVRRGDRGAEVGRQGEAGHPDEPRAPAPGRMFRGSRIRAHGRSLSLHHTSYGSCRGWWEYYNEKAGEMIPPSPRPVRTARPDPLLPGGDHDGRHADRRQLAAERFGLIAVVEGADL